MQSVGLLVMSRHQPQPFPLIHSAAHEQCRHMSKYRNQKPPHIPAQSCSTFINQLVTNICVHLPPRVVWGHGFLFLFMKTLLPLNFLSHASVHFPLLSMKGFVDVSHWHDVVTMCSPSSNMFVYLFWIFTSDTKRLKLYLLLWLCSKAHSSVTPPPAFYKERAGFNLTLKWM